MKRRLFGLVGIALLGLLLVTGRSLNAFRTSKPGSSAQSYATVCGEANTCDDAYDDAVKKCKAKKGKDWKIIGPCSDTKDGKKRQCVTCSIP